MTEQEWKDAFLIRAGFRFGWMNLESWARTMVEQAYKEIIELETKLNAQTNQS